ncbi:MAG: hypothetical protein A2293_16510 [Elusimicrobia bacterium RIFOXYB2_FULL_49_7]|nr:MAG: hypothetical protein A2293_16510 [Elusimicrobia bacterium RIFOXYB2_FULL_49_7]
MLRWLMRLAKTEALPIRISHPGIRPDLIHPHARSVVHRLHQSGYAAYIVGGAVRDLLLGLAPKDFDVATSAHPNEVRRLFRSALIIGRRFRLVHVRFGNNRIVEVATFRRHHGQETGEDPVRNDNVFGTEKEDAFRRDFTMNALFYDPESDLIIDYTGGLQDLKMRLIRCIGKPGERLAEDPVRMLRAIKFSARFNLSIERKLAKSISGMSDHIRLCSQRRLFEELLKIMRGGILSPFVSKANDLHFLDTYLPFLQTLRTRHPALFDKLLTACDIACGEEGLEPAFGFALLLWPNLKPCLSKTRDPQNAIRDTIIEFSKSFAITKNDKIFIRTLLVVKQRLDYYLTLPSKRRKFVARRLRNLPELPEALYFYRLIDEMEGNGIKNYEYWVRLLKERSEPI